MIALRPYQVEPARIGIDFFKRKAASPSLIVAPTAFGKSWLIAKIADEVNDRVLVLQPSKELLIQNRERLSLMGGSSTIYSASLNKKEISKITFATVGSIKNIGATFKSLGFTKLIVDEADRYPRSTSDSMWGKFVRESGMTHILGLTATPLKLQNNTDRDGNTFSKLVMLTSRSKHGNFFKDIIYVSQIQEIVKLGFWSKLEYEQYNIDESGLEFNSTKAEYTEESIAAVYKTNNIENMILHKLSEIEDRKSILVFVPTVADAIRLGQIMPKSAAVYGDMPDKERDAAIKKFRAGELRVIFNVNVLSVGFDHPEIDAIICARSTASLSWYYQALGRGSRISPTKQDCLIVDFSGNVRRFGRIEMLYYKKESIWKLYGEGGKLLTGCPIHEIGLRTEATEGRREAAIGNPVLTFGKYAGKHIRDTPKSYRLWMIENFRFGEHNKHIKEEILRLHAEEKKLQQ